MTMPTPLHLPWPPARPPAGGPNMSFTFTVYEFAALVRIVDEGMWEIVCNCNPSPREQQAYDRICVILGMPGYAEGDEERTA